MMTGVCGQAKHNVRELYDALTRHGIDVKFGIHPVAGRMPGHMNVLLAEANIPYDRLLDMDAINPEMAQTDVALIIGANDVTNPAARSDRTSPIYGMPSIDVEKARTVMVIKRGMSLPVLSCVPLVTQMQRRHARIACFNNQGAGGLSAEAVQYHGARRAPARMASRDPRLGRHETPRNAAGRAFAESQALFPADTQSKPPRAFRHRLWVQWTAAVRRVFVLWRAPMTGFPELDA